MSDKVLTYEGYLGSIEASVDDGCLFGQVLYVNDLITYEGQTVPELKASFINAVQKYLELCEKQKREPNKAFNGTFNVRVGPETHKAAAVYACLQGIALNELVVMALREKLDESKKKVELHQHNHTHLHQTTDFEFGAVGAYDVSENRSAPWLAKQAKVNH